MLLKIQKLNKTHNGHEWFKNRILIGSSNAKDNLTKSPAGFIMTNPRLRFVNFVEVRNFCWETFGPSCELELFGSIKGLTKDGPLSNPAWSWRYGSFGNKPEECYIYVAGQEELMLLQLKYGNT